MSALCCLAATSGIAQGVTWQPLVHPLEQQVQRNGDALLIRITLLAFVLKQLTLEKELDLLVVG